MPNNPVSPPVDCVPVGTADSWLQTETQCANAQPTVFAPTITTAGANRMQRLKLEWNGIPGRRSGSSGTRRPLLRMNVHVRALTAHSSALVECLGHARWLAAKAEAMAESTLP